MLFYEQIYVYKNSRNVRKNLTFRLFHFNCKNASFKRVSVNCRIAEVKQSRRLEYG